MRRLVAGMFLIAMLALPAAAAAGPVTDPAALQQLAAVRRATAKYHNVAAALADGYVADPHCVPGMGHHYIKPSLLGDGQIDPLQPEALLYAPTPNGGLKLVGVEYLIFAGQTAGVHPTLFNGQRFDGPMPGHAPGMPVHYDLHVAVWAHNPDGLFATFNPTTSCE